MDFKYKLAGDHLPPPTPPTLPPLSPPPPIDYTEHDHPTPETMTAISWTQNAPSESTATMSLTQNAQPETTTMMSYTQSAPLETTTMASYTKTVPPETMTMMSNTQSAPPETTTMLSYVQNAPPETRKMMSYTQNAPTTTMMSCTHSAPSEMITTTSHTQNASATTMMSNTQITPPEMTTIMSYTQNAPATTTMSYTQHHQSLTYFTQQAIRAGYVAPHLENKVDCIQHQPANMHEAIWREFEKERIREAIIAEDIARRHMLELEVRRELMMERQLAKLSGEGLSLSSPVMGFPPTFPSLKQHSDLMSLEDRMGRGILASRLGARNEIGLPFEEQISENPFQQRSVDPKISASKPVARSALPMISELQTPLEPSKEKDKIIFLAKPISGVKRKADTPPVEVGQPPSLDVPKKKIKEDWSCPLCQISATSERGLNDHLRGRKHKSKEAALLSHRLGNYSIGLLPKKPLTTNLLEANDKLNMVHMVKPKVEFLPHSQSGEGSSLVILEKEGAKDDDLEKSADVAQTKKKKSKRKFQFWCATCRIGALSEVSMEAHRNGKKHKARLQELSRVATSDAEVESAHTVNETSEDVGEKSVHTVNETSEEVGEKSVHTVNEAPEDIGEKNAHTVNVASEDVGEKCAQTVNVASEEVREKSNHTVDEASEDVGEKFAHTVNVASEDVGEKRAHSVNVALEEVGEKSAHTVNETSEEVGEKSARTVNEALEVRKKSDHTVNEAVEAVGEKSARTVNESLTGGRRKERSYC